MEILDTKEAFITLTTLLNNVIEWGLNIPILNVLLPGIIFGFIQIATCSLNQRTLLIWLHAERSIGSCYGC